MNSKFKESLRTWVLCLIFNGCISSLASAQIFITHVNLLDVVNKQVIPDQTVEIKGSVVAEIESSGQLAPTPGATVINGTGKFLMPAMTDARVHFFLNGGLYTRPDLLDLPEGMPYHEVMKRTHQNMEDFLRRYLSVGISSVLDAGAPVSFLQQRDSFENKNYCPNLFMAGPMLTVSEPAIYKDLKEDQPFTQVKTPVEGARAVEREIAHHPDFIGVCFNLNEDSLQEKARSFVPVLKAIISESHRHGLRVAVIAHQVITYELAVQSGCDYLVGEVDDSIVTDTLLQLIKSHQVTVCPTLGAADNFLEAIHQKNDFSTYTLSRSNPEFLGTITDLMDLARSKPGSQDINRLLSTAYASKSAIADSIRKANLKKMADAGISIAAGTDAGNIGTEHAASYLSELLAMKSCGLSNWQVIESATLNPAKVIGQEKIPGSIAPGKPAELILLNANPAEDLNNLQNIQWVFHKGKLIDPDTLVSCTPLSLVEQQLNGYNNRNIDAFLEPYAKDVSLYQFPDIPLSKGIEGIKDRMESAFKSYPRLHCEITQRMVQGNYVIDKEVITGMREDKAAGTVIYKIHNGKISKVYLMM